jgi:hypothetical protein
VAGVEERQTQRPRFDPPARPARGPRRRPRKGLGDSPSRPIPNLVVRSQREENSEHEARLAALGAAASLFVTAPAVAPVFHGSPVTPSSTLAKTCSASFTHAVINGAEKCLRRGQFCARAADRQYRRHGFRCRNRDARGNYHLS